MAFPARDEEWKARCCPSAGGSQFPVVVVAIVHLVLYLVVPFAPEIQPSNMASSVLLLPERS